MRKDIFTHVIIKDENENKFFQSLNKFYTMKTQDYQKQAADFLEMTNTTFICEFLKNDYHFSNDKDKRDIYQCTLKRGQRKYTFNFGQSLIKSQHYKDKNVENRLYTMSGNKLKGNYKVTDLEKYKHYLTLIPGVKPTAYDVLACLTKYDPQSFENFCNEYGYNEDSRMVEMIYKSVVNEYKSLCCLYTDSEMEKLAEIQ